VHWRGCIGVSYCFCEISLLFLKFSLMFNHKAYCEPMNTSRFQERDALRGKRSTHKVSIAQSDPNQITSTAKDKSASATSFLGTKRLN